MNRTQILNHGGLIHTCRILLAFVFIAAAMGKILDLPGFVDALKAYKLLPADWLTPAAYLLAWLEFTVGLLLLVNRWTAGAAALATSMLLVFILVILITLARGLDIDCGCFAFIRNDTLHKTLVRDIIFLLPAFVLLRSRMMTAEQEA